VVRSKGEINLKKGNPFSLIINLFPFVFKYKIFYLHPGFLGNKKPRPFEKGRGETEARRFIRRRSPSSVRMPPTGPPAFRGSGGGRHRRTSWAPSGWASGSLFPFPAG